MTVCILPATDLTTRDPATSLLDAEHVDDEARPASVEDIPQPVPVGLRFEHENVTEPPDAAKEALNAGL